MMELSSTQFNKVVAPALKSALGLDNVHQVPRITKVSLNAGLGKGLKDARFIDAVEATLTHISGQKPVKTLARKSIATFKIREGMPVGMVVTLRGKRMWEFLEKLAKLSFPGCAIFVALPSPPLTNKAISLTVSASSWPFLK